VLLLPLLAGGDKFVAAQYPELARQIITNQNVLQPVRPVRVLSSSAKMDSAIAHQ
jgi:hypothetical protein